MLVNSAHLDYSNKEEINTSVGELMSLYKNNTNKQTHTRKFKMGTWDICKSFSKDRDMEVES